MVDIKGLSGRH